MSSVDAISIDAPASEALETFETYLHGRGLRVTPERRAVLEVLLEREGHFGADELMDFLRRRGRQVSRATLYRTLDHLREAGLARLHRFGPGQALFESAHGREHHDHMMCTRCGAVVEFVNDEIEKLQDEVCRSHGFTAKHHVMQIFGVCAMCRAATPAGDRPGDKP